MESPNENPKYRVHLHTVMSLTPESSKESVNAAIAELAKTLVEPDMPPAYRRQIFAKLHDKANSYESDERMRRNPQAMYIANGIRRAVTSVRNALIVPITRK